MSIEALARLTMWFSIVAFVIMAVIAVLAHREAKRRAAARARRPKYGFVIRWHAPDDGFICTVPAFPGVSAYGSTPDSALKEAYVALDLVIEEYEADGVPLPEADQG